MQTERNVVVIGVAVPGGQAEVYLAGVSTIARLSNETEMFVMPQSSGWSASHKSLQADLLF